MTKLYKKIPKNCPICQHKDRFIIQKALDDGIDFKDIIKQFGITKNDIEKHNDNGHRYPLLQWGVEDYANRKAAMDTIKILEDYITKWADNLSNRDPNEIRDNDVLNAIKEINRISGVTIERHEITVKKTFGEVINDYLFKKDKEEEE